MNLLQLVNALERESGTIQQGSRLASVVGAPGRQEKMVEWVRDAWRIIQTSRTDWPWLWGEFDQPVVANTARYAASALGLADHGRWAQPADDYQPYSVYDPAIGRKDEQPLIVVPWARFRERWDRRTHDAMRPCEVAFSPDRKLCLGATPDKAYRIRGEYQRRAQVLTADADVPLLAEQHHMVIVYRALMLLGDHDEAPAVVQTGSAKFMGAYRAIIDDVFEAVTL